jgi:hypothetical protein
MAIPLSTAAVYLPRLFVPLLAGSLADAIPPKVILVCSNGLAMISLGLITLGAFTKHLSALLIVVSLFCIACAGMAYSVGRSTAIPDAVDKAGITRFNAHIRVASGAGDITGPLAAGFLVSRWTTGTAIGLDMITFLIAGMLATLLPFRPVIPRTRPAMRQAFEWVFKESESSSNTIRAFLWAGSLGGVAYAALSSIQMYVVLDVLRFDSLAAGAFLAIGIGGSSMTAGFVMARFGNLSRTSMVYAFGLGGGVATIIAALGIHTAWLFIVAAFFGSASWTVSVIIMGNVRMRLSPRPLLGRINGINVMVGGALATATAIVVGVVATNVGVRWPLTIFGTISTTSLALQLWKFQRAQKEVPAYVSDI